MPHAPRGRAGVPPVTGRRLEKQKNSNIYEKCCNISQNVEKIV
jgi:hypothetical protein